MRDLVVPLTRFSYLSAKIGLEGHIIGQIRLHHLKIGTGERVKVGLSPYDLSRGRITYRFSKRDLHKQNLHPTFG